MREKKTRGNENGGKKVNITKKRQERTTNRTKKGPKNKGGQHRDIISQKRTPTEGQNKGRKRGKKKTKRDRGQKTDKKEQPATKRDEHKSRKDKQVQNKWQKGSNQKKEKTQLNKQNIDKT